MRFLQGHDPSLAMRIVGRAFLPEGPRFAALDAGGDGDELLGWAFGELGVTDRARHLASLFVDDLADVIRDGIDPRFELSRYGEKLAVERRDASIRWPRRSTARRRWSTAARRAGAPTACAPTRPTSSA